MDLSLIIVNWNTGSLLRRCLDALPAACAELAYEVFVVDNASTDTSVAEARRSTQPFELLALSRNVGFARANNLALRRARGEILLLLNPDTEPRPGSFAALRSFFSEKPAAGIVGGKLFNPDGSHQPSVRAFPTLSVLVLLLTRLARLFPNAPVVRAYTRKDFSYAADARVDQVMGACFAIRRAVVERIGLLDEGFRLWFEEVDYCRRAVAAGFEVWFTPSVEVVHHQAVSFRQVAALSRSWEFSRSALLYAAKFLGPLAAAVVVLCVPISLATALPSTLVRVRPGVLTDSR